MTTWSASPSSSAGPDTHGPVDGEHVGTTPDACDQRLGDAGPTRAARRRPRATSAPERVELADERDAELDRRGARPARWSRPRRCRSRRGACRPSTRNQHDRAGRRSRGSRPTARGAAAPDDGRRDRVGGGQRHDGGRRGSASRCGRRSRTSSTAPARARSARGVAGDDVEADVVADPLEVRGRRDRRRRASASRRRDGLGRAGGADQVAGDALGRRDRRRRRRRTPCGSPRPRPRRSAASTCRARSRGRSRRRRARRRRARAACTRRRPRRRATAR